MFRDNSDLARIGEELAVEFLKKKDYKILERNFRTILGELDIIAKDKETICFIEVKTRSSDKFGLPQESIDRLKQRKLSQAAMIYLKDRNLLQKPARFDVVSVLNPQQDLKIDLIQNAFEINVY
ncbi:MAG: YraN family protein [Candidatus Omnitrophica bacterium]|nr:YraN family protein [Candidatus Omnitrophota bacterium]